VTSGWLRVIMESCAAYSPPQVTAALPGSLGSTASTACAPATYAGSSARADRAASGRAR